VRGLPITVTLDSELWNYIQAVATAYQLSTSAAAAMVIRNSYSEMLAKTELAAVKPKGKKK